LQIWVQFQLNIDLLTAGQGHNNF